MIGAAGLLTGPLVALMASALATREPLAVAVRGARAEVRGRPLRTAACAVVHGALWATAALRWGPTWAGLVMAGLFSVLLVVSVVDVEHSRIPDRLSRPAAAAGLALAGLGALVGRDATPLLAALVGSAAFGASLGVAHLASPRGMGRGDVKLAVLLGLALGWVARGPVAALGAVVAAVIVASLVGTAVGLLLLIRRRRNAPYPFGPALVAGTVVTLLAAERLLAA